MKVTIRPTVAVLLLLLTLSTTTTAQQKRQTPARPQPKPAAAPAPAPTFETLIPAESYTVYGEVRNVGHLIQSNAANEVLEPILALSKPSKEFKTFVNWLKSHSDDLMSSRLLVATWPTSKQVPEIIVAVEFASTEEAAKFATPFKQLMSTVVSPAEKPSPEPQTENAKSEAPRGPGFHMQQAGSLILMTPTPLSLKKLKPAGAKLLSEDNNFRAARNRFNSELVFVYVDLKMKEQQDEERRKQHEEARVEAERAQKEAAAALEETKKSEGVPENELSGEESPEKEIELGNVLSVETKEGGIPDPVLMSMTSIGSLFFTGESNWPEGIGLALTLEADSFDVRALFVSQAGEKSDAVPFVPMLIPGPAFVPESPNIIPADTELFAAMSLDLAQIYTQMSKPRPNQMSYTRRGRLQTVHEQVVESPFAAIEKKLKMDLKDDLVPLLGSEIALRLPVTGLNMFGIIAAPIGMQAIKDESSDQQAASKAGPALFISLRDKEGMRALMPKLIEALGFKGANSFAQTERKEDTEIVNYLNYFSYAFIGNFLVLSSDPVTIRHIVDSYLKHQTLAADGNFKNYTRWQPRPAQGQVYISPALMESYKSWIDHPSARLSEPTKVFFRRLTAVPQPITYSLSNEGLGPLHELHLPKNLVLMAVTGISNETNPTPIQANEASAIGLMYSIVINQEQYKKEKGAGSFGTLEQLIAADMLSKEMIERSGYKFELTVTGDKFEVFAVPVEYGKTGTMSYYMDQSYVLRGGDRSGASASSSDPRIQ